jgi:hypothetical protein
MHPTALHFHHYLILDLEVHACIIFEAYVFNSDVMQILLPHPNTYCSLLPF